jgi:endonuclease G, mitochondrial
LEVAVTREEKIRRLRALLAHLAADGGGDLESLAYPRASSDLPGFEWVTGDEAETARAQTALAKLARGDDDALGPNEIDAFEAIVLLRNRPVAYVERDTYADFEAPWQQLNAAGTRAALTPLLAAVGRIEMPDSLLIPYVGTGFVVGPGLVMTNRHVAQLFCQGVGERLLFQRSAAAIHFGRERDASGDYADASAVTGVVMMHPYWDMALLRTESTASEPAPLTLAAHEPRELIGRDIVVIGHPARDMRNNAAEQDRIFASTYNVKRLQPGRLRDRQLKRSYGFDVPAQVHDASTLGGNSGSAIVDVATAQVVGLHFAGEYLVANYAVPMHELARDPRVAAAGVRFVGSAAGSDTNVEEAWRLADREEILDA